MTSTTRMLGAIVITVGLAACGPPGFASVTREADQPEPTLFRDVTVFDGVDVHHHRDVLIEGGAITAVEETGKVDAARGGVVVDGTGRTLLPGLIDSHTHLMSAGEKRGSPPDEAAIARAFLYAGVTTLLVTASPVDLAPLREASRGAAVLPHLYTAGSGLTAPGGHPTSLLRAMLPWPIRWFAIRDLPTAANAAEARACVDEVIDARAPDFFKIIGSSQGSVQLWPVPWLISQALSSTYVAGEHRLYLERNCRLSESPAHGTRRKSRGACQCQGAEQSARVRPSGKTSAKVQAAFHECSWFVAL